MLKIYLITSSSGRYIIPTAKWMGEMLQHVKNKEFIYMDPHGAFLQKSGNIQEAKKVANDALNLPKSKGVNYKAERKIREAKIELEKALQDISIKIEEANRGGNQDKMVELQELRLEKINSAT